MSRSRKKTGVIKDKGLTRAEYNRIFRRVNKQRIHNGQEPKTMRELINPWDVSDYSFRWYETEGRGFYDGIDVLPWYRERHLEYIRTKCPTINDYKRSYFKK